MPVADSPPPARTRALDPSRYQRDEMKVVGRLPFDPPDVAGYMRVGGCTLGCGACCEAVILALREFDGLQDAAFDDWQHWLGLHGITLFRNQAGILCAHIPIPCSKLGPDKECQAFGTPDRPQMCAKWPEHPMQMLRVKDFCTYDFIPLPVVENRCR